MTCAVHYVGYLPDGKVFDATYRRGRPFKFKLGQEQVIEGLDTAISQLSAGERASFFEDLEDLESEVYDVHGKMLVLQRIYRTQPALLAGGGAASAGAAQQGEFGPGMQLDPR